MFFGWSHGVWSIFNVQRLHLVKVWNIEKYSTAGKGSTKDTVKWVRHLHTVYSLKVYSIQRQFEMCIYHYECAEELDKDDTSVLMKLEEIFHEGLLQMAGPWVLLPSERL